MCTQMPHDFVNPAACDDCVSHNLRPWILHIMPIHVEDFTRRNKITRDFTLFLTTPHSTLIVRGEHDTFLNDFIIN